MEPSKHQPSEDDRSTGKGSFGDNPWKAMGLVGAVGADLAICLGIGYWIGSRADGSSGGVLYSMLGMLGGLVVGIATVFLLIRTYTGGKKS